MQDTKANALGYNVPAKFYATVDEFDRAAVTKANPQGTPGAALRAANGALWDAVRVNATRNLITALAAVTGVVRVKKQTPNSYMAQFNKVAAAGAYPSFSKDKAERTKQVQAIADKLSPVAVNAAEATKTTGIKAQGKTPEACLEQAKIALEKDAKATKAITVLKTAGIDVVLNGDTAANIKTLGRGIFAHKQKMKAEMEAKTAGQYA